MLLIVVMGAQQCFHGPETGALVPCHMALFCLLFFILCLWEEKDLLCCWSWEASLHCLLQTDGWWFEQESHCTWEVSRLLPCCARCCFLLALQRLWDSPLHLLPFLCSSGRPLISKQSRGKSVGRIFFSGATRSPFSTSEELEEWIWILYPVF